MKSYKTAAIAYGALLLAFTGFLMLDTFVLSSAEQKNAVEMNLSLFAEQTENETSAAERVNTAQTQSTADTASASGTERTAVSGTDAASDPQTQTVSTGSTEQGTAAPQSSSAAQTEGSTASSSSSASVQTTASAQTTEAAVQRISNDTQYQDENICISLSQYTEYGTTIYVADVRVSSAQYLKTAFAQNTYGKNITAPTSEIAAENNAILAINGDFYGTHSSGYVIRNGVLYRDRQRAGTDYLCIMADGSFLITTDDEYSAQELLDLGAWQCFMFGPRLVENGTVAVDENAEVSRAMTSNPRTAIGIIDDLHYVFVVSDGRTDESEGLSLYQLAEFMQGLGADTAYNLDGGGSSTMIFNGNLINNPTTSGKSISERSVSDIVYIGY